MKKTVKAYRLDDKTISMITRLKDERHLDSNCDVLKQAVKLLDLCTKAEQKGESVKIGDKHITLI